MVTVSGRAGYTILKSRRDAGGYRITNDALNLETSMRSFRCESRQKGQRNDPEDVLIFTTKEDEEGEEVAEQEHPGRGEENWVRTICQRPRDRK